MRKFEVIWRSANDQRGLVKVSRVKGLNNSDAVRTVRRLQGERIFVLGVQSPANSAIGSF
ncbi:MAG: hypothetical protein AMS21_01780 [Gemmatimonas sp. SG8_38_2]|jgi:hypothetical protein|nr:MAG: hypothetical protein AMS21_01780 [Gemmatimonas sp. SG8_38_2]